MTRSRRRAAAVLLAWIAIGLLASAGTGHAAGEAPDRHAAPCHAAQGSPVGAPAGEPLPHGPPVPCQWALPLLCCEQPLAADAANAGLVTLPALLLRTLAPVVDPPPRSARTFAAARPASLAPLSERSVVLQV